MLKLEIPNLEEISKACHWHVKVKGEGTILALMGVRLEDFNFKKGDVCAFHPYDASKHMY